MNLRQTPRHAAPRPALRPPPARLAARPRLLALLLAAAGLPVAAQVPAGTRAQLLAEAAAVVPQRAQRSFPTLRLPDTVSRGQRALDLLGQRLPEVAAFYDKSPDEFRARMLNDRSWRLDQRGRVFIVEELERPLPVLPEAAGTTSLVDGTLAPLDQTFLLHSKPGAARTIYLNFKGASLSGTAWNGSTGTRTALPFDLDGVPYTFSTTELQRIQGIWQRVAEDYAPFDVNVTTEAVDPALITRSGSTDTVFGTTVLITSSVGVYNCACGGVAYLGVFDDTTDYYKPALVFYNQLGGGSEKYVAEAASHEAGHNMGLSHDGTASVGYYSGHGVGATAWAPIMGVGYSKPVTQWSRGEYTSANNTQDDFAVMQSNGLPLRADDHGNTLATATPMGGTTSGGISALQAGGVIARASDIDVFSLAAGAGTATVTLSPAARAPNLDAVLTLRDAAGNLLATANPLEALGASLSTVLPAAGTYYLQVQGTGKGNPATDGYSSYGSVGQYALAASVPAPTSQAPKAVIGASVLRGTAPLTVGYNGAGSSDPDGSVAAWAWTFSDGSTAAGPSTSRTYTVPGSYTTQLRVTDDSGLSAATSVTVTVDAPVLVQSLRVADIAMSRSVARNGSAQAVAVVRVVDGNGLPVVNATVAGSWTGLAPRTGTAFTNGSGAAAFASPVTRATTGTFTFTVTGITLAGYTYQPTANTETSDSIAR